MTDVEVDFDSDLARLVELNQATHGRDGLRTVEAISIQTLRESQRGAEQLSRLGTSLDILRDAIPHSNGQPEPPPPVQVLPDKRSLWRWTAFAVLFLSLTSLSFLAGLLVRWFSADQYTMTIVTH